MMKEKPQKFNGDAIDAPNIESYFSLWGKHEFNMEHQRNLLLWFLNDKGLDKEFMKFLDYWFPEDEDEVRQSREEMKEKFDKLQNKLKA